MTEVLIALSYYVRAAGETAFLLIVASGLAKRRHTDRRGCFLALLMVYLMAVVSLVLVWTSRIVRDEMHIGWLLTAIGAGVAISFAIRHVEKRYERNSDDADTHEADIR